MKKLMLLMVLLSMGYYGISQTVTLTSSPFAYLIGKDTFCSFSASQTRQLLVYLYKYSQAIEQVYNLSEQVRFQDTIISEQAKQISNQKKLVDNYLFEVNETKKAFDLQVKVSATNNTKYTRLQAFQKWYWVIIGGLTIGLIVK